MAQHPTVSPQRLSPWTPPLKTPLSSMWDICTRFVVIVIFGIWSSAYSIYQPCRGHCGCAFFFRCNRFSPVTSLSAGAAMNSSESLPPSSSVNDISSMSTDQTLASDTDSSLETSAGPLGCCRWLTACLRNPVFFRRWTHKPRKNVINEIKYMRKITYQE